MTTLADKIEVLAVTPITDADCETASDVACALADLIVLGNHGAGNAAVLIDRFIAAMQADAAPVATSDRRDAITAAKDVLAGRGNGTYDEALDAIRWLLQSAGIHDAPVADRVSTPKPVDDRGSAKTRDKLRDAVEVWWQAETAFEAAYTGDGDQAQRAATAIIEADREAVRAALVAEIVAWMRGNCMSGKWRVLASEIEEKWSKL